MWVNHTLSVDKHVLMHCQLQIDIFNGCFIFDWRCVILQHSYIHSAFVVGGKLILNLYYSILKHPSISFSQNSISVCEYMTKWLIVDFGTLRLIVVVNYDAAQHWWFSKWYCCVCVTCHLQCTMLQSNISMKVYGNLLISCQRSSECIIVCW